MSDDDFDDRYTECYQELKRLAAAVVNGRGRRVLGTTTLVHEAWERLHRHPQLAGLTRRHFKRIAARQMHQILIDKYRELAADKRGAGAMAVSFDDEDSADSALREVSLDRMHDVEEAIEELRHIEGHDGPKLVAITINKFFGGMTDQELAEEVDWPLAQVYKELRFIRATLLLRLKEYGGTPMASEP